MGEGRDPTSLGPLVYGCQVPVGDGGESAMPPKTSLEKPTVNVQSGTPARFDYFTTVGQQKPLAAKTVRMS
jgi:hypothetical protein